MRTAGDREQDRHGGYLPIVGAAIKHQETGEITRGENHLCCRLAAYRITTGDVRTNDELLALSGGEEPKDANLFVSDMDHTLTVFERWAADQVFEEGFCNSIGMFFNRATATQIVCKRLGRDTITAEMPCDEILAVGLGKYKSGGALPPDNKIEKVDVDDEW